MTSTAAVQQQQQQFAYSFEVCYTRSDVPVADIMLPTLRRQARNESHNEEEKMTKRKEKTRRRKKNHDAAQRDTGAINPNLFTSIT